MPKRSFLAALTTVLAIAAGASPASAASNLQVAPTGSDAGDCVSSACATVSYAVGQAAADDTIEVAAGRYDEEIAIAVPGLTLQGAAGGGTVIGPEGSGAVEQTAITLTDGVDGVTLRDLEVDSRAQYQPAILATGSAAIDGLTLDGVAITGLGPSASPATVANGLEVNAPGSGWKILDSVIEGNYHGLAVFSDLEAFTVEGSSFTGNRIGFNVERVTPLTPDSTGQIDGLTLLDSSFEQNEYRGLYFEGLSEAAIEGIVVSGTGEGKTPLPSGARALALNLKAGDFGEVSISDSRFSGSVNEGVLLQVRGYAGDSSYESAPATLDSFTLTGSTLSGNGGPGFALDNQANIGSVSVTGSRIVGNGTQAPGAVTPVNGIFAWNQAENALTVDAAENWFACNEGPAAASCAAVNSPVLAPTWLVLGVGTAFPSLGFGEQTAVVAALESSAGGDPVVPVPDGAEALFSSALGSFEEPSVPLLTGLASSTFVAGNSAGSGAVTASVDGEQASAPITVRAPLTSPDPIPDPTPPASPAPQPPAAPEKPTIESTGGKGPTPVPTSGTVAVATVSCAAESCVVKAQGAPSVKVGGKAYKVQVKLPKRLGSGDSAKVRVVLPKKVRAALAEEGKGKLRLRLKVTGSDGTARTMTVTVALKGKGGKQAKGG